MINEDTTEIDRTDRNEDDTRDLVLTDNNITVTEILQKLRQGSTLKWVPRWISQLPRRKGDLTGDKRDLLLNETPIDRPLAQALVALIFVSSAGDPPMLRRRDAQGITYYEIIDT